MLHKVILAIVFTTMLCGSANAGCQFELWRVIEWNSYEVGTSLANQSQCVQKMYGVTWDHRMIICYRDDGTVSKDFLPERKLTPRSTVKHKEKTIPCNHRDLGSDHEKEIMERCYRNTCYDGDIE